MSKHTPGPWTTLAGDWDKELEGYCRYTIKPLKVLNIGDAHLIAAAPEMYEALKAALEDVAEIEAVAGVEAPSRKKLWAALAKAEGRL